MFCARIHSYVTIFHASLQFNSRKCSREKPRFISAIPAVSFFIQNRLQLSGERLQFISVVSEQILFRHFPQLSAGRVLPLLPHPCVRVPDERKRNQNVFIPTHPTKTRTFLTICWHLFLLFVNRKTSRQWKKKRKTKTKQTIFPPPRKVVAQCGLPTAMFWHLYHHPHPVRVSPPPLMLAMPLTPQVSVSFQLPVFRIAAVFANWFMCMETAVKDPELIFAHFLLFPYT